MEEKLISKGYPHCKLCKGEGAVGFDNVTTFKSKDATMYIGCSDPIKIKSFEASREVPRKCPRCFGPDGMPRKKMRFMQS